MPSRKRNKVSSTTTSTPDKNPAATSHYKYFAVRRCNSLQSAAIFTSWYDFSDHVDTKSGNVDYRFFPTIQEAVDYIESKDEDEERVPVLANNHNSDSNKKDEDKNRHNNSQTSTETVTTKIPVGNNHQCDGPKSNTPRKRTLDLRSAASTAASLPANNHEEYTDGTKDESEAQKNTQGEGDTTVQTNSGAQGNTDECTQKPEASDPMDQQIEFALHELDLESRPRLSRTSADVIQVNEKKKQADEQAKNLVIHTAVMWGWNNHFHTHKRRLEIAKAACRQVAYDLGYPIPLAYTGLPVWYEKLKKSIGHGEKSNPLSSNQKGTKKYVDVIEETHPGYILELFRYAQEVIGRKATYKELAQVMNTKSAEPGEDRPTLSIERRQLSDWFRAKGRKALLDVDR